MRRAPHEGQNPRRLQENATGFSWAQPAQRRRRKPCARRPHSRKASNSSLTNSGRPVPVPGLDLQRGRSPDAPAAADAGACARAAAARSGPRAPARRAAGLCAPVPSGGKRANQGCAAPRLGKCQKKPTAVNGWHSKRVEEDRAEAKRCAIAAGGCCLSAARPSQRQKMRAPSACAKGIG